MENKIYTSSVSLVTIGIITGIVLCVLQHSGTINIGWFWATFPFWAPAALEISLFLIAVAVALIMSAIEVHHNAK